MALSTPSTVAVCIRLSLAVPANVGLEKVRTGPPAVTPRARHAGTSPVSHAQTITACHSFLTFSNKRGDASGREAGEVDGQDTTTSTPSASVDRAGPHSHGEPPTIVSTEVSTGPTPAPAASSAGHEGHQAGPFDDAAAVQVERVETLLAAVRDIVSSLGATSAQLEREVAQALRPAPPRGAHAHPSRQRSTPTGSVERGAGRPEGDLKPVQGSLQDALEAERAALLEAVEHRAVIEQAKGMLMLKHRCDADDAFGLLLEISRRERRKVREIAADLVRAGSRPRPLVDLTAQHDRPTVR
jgi:ANTAR domain